MSQLYFLLPSAQLGERLIGEIADVCAPHRDIRMVANASNGRRGRLPEDFQPASRSSALGLGFGLGGSAGVMGSSLAVALPPAQGPAAGPLLLVAVLAAAMLGGLLLRLLTGNQVKRERGRLRRAVASGAALVMVDTPAQQVTETRRCIRRHYPEAAIGIAVPLEAPAAA